ncbi:MAG: glycosyltransferase [Planctomycetota bacterium]
MQKKHGPDRPWLVMVMSQWPYPPVAGNTRRILSLARHLSGAYRLALVTTSGPRPSRSALAEVFQRIDHAPRGLSANPRDHSLRGRLRVLRGWWRQRRYDARERRAVGGLAASWNGHPFWRERRTGGHLLARVCREVRPVALIAEYGWMMLPEGLIARGLGVPVVLDTHDVISRRAASARALGLEPRIDVIEAEEAAVLELADLVVAIQTEEAEHLRGMLPGKRVITVMHPAEPVRPDPALEEQPGEVLFVGSKAAHNVDALRWFIQEAWPAVLGGHPAARLRVVGSIAEALPDPELRLPSIDWTGRVENLEPVYARAQVVVCCPRFGSGLKIKTVEALAHGKPLVTTPLGVEGLDGVGSACRVVSLQEFGDAVAGLLVDKPGRAELSEAAAVYAATQLSAAFCFRELDSELRRLACPE